MEAQAGGADDVELQAGCAVCEDDAVGVGTVSEKTRGVGGRCWETKGPDG